MSLGYAQSQFICSKANRKVFSNQKNGIWNYIVKRFAGTNSNIYDELHSHSRKGNEGVIDVQSWGKVMFTPPKILEIR